VHLVGPYYTRDRPLDTIVAERMKNKQLQTVDSRKSSSSQLGGVREFPS
jgi:hypothetical protein